MRRELKRRRKPNADWDTFEVFDFPRGSRFEWSFQKVVVGGEKMSRRNQDSCHDPPQREVSHLTSSTYNLSHCTISLPIW